MSAAHDNPIPSPREAKRLARTHAKQRLASLTPEVARVHSAAICQRLAEFARSRPPRAVFLYLPVGPAEPDIIPFAQSLRTQSPDTLIAAPRIDWDAGTMNAVELAFDQSGTPRTETRRHNIPEPLPLPPSASFSQFFPPETFDLILVPGLAFTPNLSRLGRGAGYYDRWLDTGSRGSQATVRPFRLGVCFDTQIAQFLPTEPHDVQMDAIATECRLIKA